MSLDLDSGKLELEPTPLDTEPSTEPGWPDDGVSLASDELAAEPVARAEPVSASQRYFSVDVIRGFALLGILAMNIVGFGWPEAAYGNPFRGAGFDGLDRVVWFFNHMIFEVKMMTIFSMLFGAGLVLMDQRAEQRGAKIKGVYYRRILWLLVIGLVHAYLIWWGDILVLYAECGLFLYFFRNLGPRTLIILGFAAMMLLVPLILGFAAGFDFTRRASARYEAQIKAGEWQKTTGVDHLAHDLWTEHLREVVEPNLEKQAKEWNKELAAYRGSYCRDHQAPCTRLDQGADVRIYHGRRSLRDEPHADRHGTDETGRLLGPAVAKVLPVDGRPGLWNRLAAHDLRRRQNDRKQILVRI